MKSIPSASILLLVALLSNSSGPSHAQQEEGLFTIGTAVRGRVYHPVGNAICRFVNAGRERHGLRCLAEPSAGSVDNVGALRSGERAYGIVQSDVQHAALTGHGRFAKLDGYQASQRTYSGWLSNSKANSYVAGLLSATGACPAGDG
jgi:uncharacterized protein